ncbi:acetyltransferase [Maribrevibacterium harenarium]|uniref:acetyltransferase n=1 Tax=Maribrevibacterium harenarium TaxID=2589817 RepID=UPI0015E47184|nr:acetyltransferase [Maribrevibacterium harenarium]
MLQSLCRSPLLCHLVGVLSFTVIALNVMLWVSLIHILALLLLLPFSWANQFVETQVNRCFSAWVSTNEWWFRHMLGVCWDLDPQLQSDFQQSHLLIANHRSWVDVFLLLAQLNGRLRLPRVFMKSSLRWLPLIGSATYIMGFPQVKRYSKEQIANKPHLAGKDLHTTRKACERFKRYPNNLLSFVEGTRFTAKKHQHQQSPYQTLLKPRSGGIAYVLEALPGHFDHLVDFNLSYPQENCSFWDLLTGQLTCATVRATKVPFPATFLQSDFHPAGKDKAAFFTWFNQYWTEKDQRLLAQQQEACLLESSQNGAINECHDQNAEK